MMQAPVLNLSNPKKVKTHLKYKSEFINKEDLIE